MASNSSNNSRVVEIDPLADARWDEFVHAHPRATGHHLSAWAQILKSCYRYKPKYIALESQGQLTGVLPLASSGLRLSGSRLSSLPTAKAAGPLAASPEDERSLLIAAVDVKRRERLASLMVRSESPALEHEQVRVLQTDVTHVLELTGTAEELLDSYKRSSQNMYRSIRKAQKAQLAIAEASSERELREWYRLYLHTIRKHRNLPRRLRQFKEERALLGSTWRLVTVSSNGAIIAGGVFHEIANRIELIYNASDSENLSLRPNHALYWHVIKEGKDRGLSALDFGVSGHESLRRFKSQWGAVAQDVYIYADSARREDAPATARSAPGDGSPANTSSEETTSAKPGLMGKARQLLGTAIASAPPSVNRAIGVVAYRTI